MRFHKHPMRPLNLEFMKKKDLKTMKNLNISYIVFSFSFSASLRLCLLSLLWLKRSIIAIQFSTFIHSLHHSKEPCMILVFIDDISLALTFQVIWCSPVLGGESTVITRVLLAYLTSLGAWNRRRILKFCAPSLSYLVKITTTIISKSVDCLSLYYH